MKGDIWLKTTHSSIFAMTGRRKTGLLLYTSEVFSVGFLSSQFIQACMNVVVISFGRQ